MTQLICGNCLDVLKTRETESIDMILTSPPYDNIRNYHGYSFEFETIAQELFRVLKKNRVIVWVVNDATIKGSETGSSFRQALYFMECGFLLHDTMFYKKRNPMPLRSNRYTQCMEYMFCLSKGKPEVFNPIMTECKFAGDPYMGKSRVYDVNGEFKVKKRNRISEEKIHENMFEYFVGSIARYSVKGHPAQFPVSLALDQIGTWSNEGDLVLDPFCGASTTGIACKKLNRRYIGIDISESYIELSRERLAHCE